MMETAGQMRLPLSSHQTDVHQQQAQPQQPEQHDPTQEQLLISSPQTSPDPEQSDTWLSGSDDNISTPPRPVPDAEADQADNVLGISIGRAQNRMKARQTPAEEKSRAIESSGGYFDVLPIPDAQEGLEEQGEYRPQFTEEPEPIDDAPAATAPSQAPQSPKLRHDGGKKAEKSASRSGGGRYSLSILKSSLSGRRRALSGDSNYSLKLKKLFPDFNRSPSRQNSSQAKASSVDLTRSRSPRIAQTEAAAAESPNTGSNSSTTINSSDDGLAALADLQNSSSHSYKRYPTSKKRPPMAMRHSMSDESLYLRSLSRVSTLEHRPHYENIHSMVNSRYKAIKDSLQDSSSRIFSIPSFNLPDFRHEWHPGRFLGDYQRKDGVAADGVFHNSNGNDSNGDFNSNNVDTNHNGNPRANLRQNTIYPILDEVASTMRGDVVVMGGYRGSILRSAKPPHRQLWVPMKVGLNIRKVDLEVGLTHEDEERMEETIIAREVLSHIGPVDICRRLLQRFRKFEKLRNGAVRVWDYGYDWRLSPHLLSRRLIKYLEGLPCNAPDVPPEKRGAYVIAHSLGGLITRHAVNQRPDLFAGVVYAGTPQHCVNILGPLRNGDEVLLSSKVLTAQVNFSIRTSFVLLPDDGRCFINKDTKEEYLVDFFDVKTWDEYALSPCISPTLPALGNESKKSLMDNLPNSLSTLPRMGLGKRLSVKLNGSKTKDLDDDPSFSSKSGTLPNRPHTTGSSSSIGSGGGSAVGGTAGAAKGMMGPNTAKPDPSMTNVNTQTGTASTCTIPRDKALEYLDRTLKEVRQFRQELAFNESQDRKSVV